MSKAACKAAICLNNAKTTVETVDRIAFNPLNTKSEFTDEQLEKIAACSDKFTYDLMLITQQD